MSTVGFLWRVGLEQLANPAQLLEHLVRVLGFARGLDEVGGHGRRQEPEQADADEHEQRRDAAAEGGDRRDVAVADGRDRCERPPQRVVEGVDGAPGVTLGEEDQTRSGCWRDTCEQQRRADASASQDQQGDDNACDQPGTATTLTMQRPGCRPRPRDD